MSDTVRREVLVGAEPTLTIDSDAGPIEVQAGEPGRIDVTAERSAGSRQALDEIALAFEQDGDSLRIAYRRPKRAFDAGDSSVRFTVRAPANTGLDLKTSGGSVVVAGFANGGKVTTGGGSVRSIDLQGDQSLKTGGGSIVVEGGSGTITAETSGGSITSTNVKGSQSLTTSGGGIRVSEADGTIQAYTSGGGVEIEGRLIGKNRAWTSGGNVTIRLPADSNLTVCAHGTSASNDFGLAVRNNGQIEGRIGSGADGTLAVSTSGGSVALLTL